MNDVQVIKANRNENRIRGRKVEILRVAAYCRVSTGNKARGFPENDKRLYEWRY